LGKALRVNVIMSVRGIAYDYSLIERNANCIIDARNAFKKNNLNSKKVYMA
jgi:hypothetical protein